MPAGSGVRRIARAQGHEPENDKPENGAADTR